MAYDWNREGYRTQQARDTNRLSRESGPQTITLEKNSSGTYSKIADVSTSKGQLTIPDKGQKHWKQYAADALKLARLLTKAHPYLRAFDLGMALVDIYRQYYTPTKQNNGAYIFDCSAPTMAKCVSPGVPCVDSYCAGPEFNLGFGWPCGIAGQAIPTGNKGTFPLANNAGHGVEVWMRRPAPFCHPGYLVQRYTLTGPTAPNRQHFTPHRIKRMPVQFPPWKRMRWLSPDTLQKPYEFAPEPEAPPYEHIPHRDLSPNTDRGNEIGTDTHTRFQPFQPPAFRKPPGRREVHRKFKSTATAEALHRALTQMSAGLGKLTDLRDLIGALHDALPKELQLKGPQKKMMGELLRRVATNLDKLDGEKALENIIKEVAEDVVGGVADQYAAEAAKQFGWFKQKFFLSARF